MQGGGGSQKFGLKKTDFLTLFCLMLPLAIDNDNIK